MPKEINRIVKILMERDEMTHVEAHDFVLECISDMPSEYTFIDLEETLISDLGLEPDYVMDLDQFLKDNPYVED